MKNTIIKNISFRTCRGIFSLAAALLALSCEKVVDFPADENGRIYIDAILGQKDGGRINLAVSQPALGSEDASAEDITLSLKADGEPVSLVRDMDYVPETEGMVSYLVEGSFRPDQQLELVAESPDLPSAKALTTVPASLRDVKLTYKEVNTYKNRDPEQTMGNLITLLEFNMAMDEKPDTDIYFGVQVCKRAVYDTVGTVPDHTWEQYEKKYGIVEYDDLYIDATYTEGSAISSAVKEMFVLYDGGEMQVSPAEPEGDGAAVKAYVYPTRKQLMQGSYHDDARYEIYEVFEYDIHLYRLSPEVYRCLKARYIIDNSRVPIHLGFSPVTYTYTNVEGGLGMFGAVSEYESGWFRIENNENE